MPGRRDSRARRPLPPGYFTIWSTVAIDLIGFGVIIPVLALYAERFGASATQVGLLGSAYSLAQFVAAPLWGRLSDRIGRKPVLLLSLVGTALASVACGLAGSLAVLFVARALDGASGASIAAAQAAVSDIADPDDRPRLLGLLAAAFGVGFVIGPAIGGLAALGGPRVPFFVAGALAGANAIAAWIRLPETRAPGVEVDRAARHFHGTTEAGVVLARSWRERGIPFLVATTFASIGAFSAFEWTFALFGQRRLDLTEASTAAVFVVIGLLISAVQGGVVPRVVPALGDLRTLRTGLVVAAAGLFLLAPVHSFVALAPPMVLLALGQGLAQVTLTSSVVARTHPSARGAVLGVQQSAGSLARVVGPALGGAAFHHVGVSAPYIGGGTVLGLCALVTVAGRTRVVASNC